MHVFIIVIHKSRMGINFRAKSHILLNPHFLSNLPCEVQRNKNKEVRVHSIENSLVLRITPRPSEFEEPYHIVPLHVNMRTGLIIAIFLLRIEYVHDHSSIQTEDG
jgi:hypothetical protein